MANAVGHTPLAKESPFDFTPDSSRPVHGGVQHKFKFANGYGASVVRHSFSYGGESGLWELAVLGLDGSLTYDTPITSDVIGRLTVAEVNETLREIKKLPS